MPYCFKLVILSLLLFFQISFASQTHFKVSYDPDYAPFSYKEKNKAVGLLIDYWELWAEKNNYTIDFVDGKNWDNAHELLRKNKVDYFLGGSAYKKWMIPSKQFYRTKTSLFILKNHSRGFNEKASYLIGIIGKDYKNIIKRHFKNSNIIIYKDYKNAFKDFTSKKIDLIFDDKIAIEYYTLRNNLFHNIRSINLIDELSKVYAISKKKKLAKIFNDGLKNISPEEFYDVESKWILNESERFYSLKKKIKLSRKEIDFLKNTTIKITASKTWEPLIYKTHENVPKGIAYDIFTLLSKQVNLKYKYSFFDNFSQELNAVKEKNQDMIISTGKTNERLNYSIFTKSYASFPLSIVTLKDENFIENLDSISNKVIAVSRNFTAHKLIRENYPGIKLLLVNNVKDGLRKVISKKAYAFVDIKPILDYNIKKYNFNALKISGNTGLIFKLRIMIRKDYPLLKSILDKAIDNLNPNKVETVINRWNNIQFENNFNFNKLLIPILGIVLIIILLLYINHLNVKRNKLLKQKVDERTKDLLYLNEVLEQKVENKTKQLKESNYLLDEAQKIAHLGSFQYNVKKDQLIWSNELYKIFGLLRKKVRPSLKLFLSFIHKNDKRYVINQLYKIKNNKQKLTSEFKIVLKDGSTKYIQSSSKATKFDKDNKPLIVIGTILDLTNLKQLEIENRENDSLLAQQSKMAAMGEMLENIAHQWRQPLSAITTVSTGIQIQLELNQEVSQEALAKNINLINNQAQYLSKTIDDFRNFFNPNKVKINFNIQECLQKVLYLIDSKLSNTNIEVITNLESININSFESELIQVLINILNNAADALEGNKNQKNLIFIKNYVENKRLFICIKDNANGIPKKIITRIFEPYFTTKHKSQGTGIGLYMSSQIINKHLNGRLKVKNTNYLYKDKKYKGAEFIIELPL